MGATAIGVGAATIGMDAPAIGVGVAAIGVGAPTIGVGVAAIDEVDTPARAVRGPVFARARGDTAKGGASVEVGASLQAARFAGGLVACCDCTSTSGVGL